MDTMNSLNNSVPQCAALQDAVETNKLLIENCHAATKIDISNLQSIPSKSQILEICKKCPDLLEAFSKVKCPTNADIVVYSQLVQSVCNINLGTSQPQPPTTTAPVSNQKSHSNPLRIITLTTIGAMLIFSAMIV